MSNHVTLWVCEDCLVAGDDSEYANPDREPWGLWEDDAVITDGIVVEEHWCGYERDQEDEAPCQGECEQQSFSWTPCMGCGSNLGGARYAFTWWED